MEVGGACAAPGMQRAVITGFDAQKQGGYAYSDSKSEPPSHGWSEHTAPEGYVYYYNSKTGVSQWERPSEMQ